MKSVSLVILSVVVVSTILGSAFLLGLARPASSAPVVTTFEYRAKWICNSPESPFPGGVAVINTTSPENIGLVPGEYKTDINVHNPSHSVAVEISKTFVVSVAEFRPPGPIAPAFAITLLPAGGAFFIDCRDIFQVYSKAGISLCPGFGNVTCAVKGFVIMDQFSSAGVGGFSSASTLDVVGEYSSESFAPGPSTNFCIFPGSQVSVGSCVSSGISLDVVPIPASPFVP